MRTLTFDLFLERAIKKHGDKYDYSLANDGYVNTSSNIKIICPIHGERAQTPKSHLNGYGCRECSYDNRSNTRKKTKDTFIDDAKNVHGELYDYSLVVYNTSRHKVKIICLEHGEFEKSPNHHLKGQGCPKCSTKIFEVINNKRHDDIKKNFVNKARNVHINDFEYLTEYIDSKTKILIKCNKCGLEFNQKPHAHLSGNGCPHCNMSKGEKYIERCLLDNNIVYESEKWFNDCRGFKRPLPFDFWIPSKNMLIEFQGRHHYEKVNFKNAMTEHEMNDNFESTKRNDNKKKQYCIDNGITLLEIHYTEIKNIDKILMNNIGE